MSTQQRSAPEAGLLPTPVGVVLTIIAGGAILFVGESAGYARESLAGFLLSGVIGAGAVHLASRDTVPAAIGSVLVMWTAGIVYVAVLAGLLADLVFDLSLAIIPAGLVLIGALLAPFGLLGSTVSTYGMGGVQKLLKRYYLGTIVFVIVGLITVVILSFDAVSMISEETANIDLGHARDSATAAGEQVFAEIELYAVFAISYLIIGGVGVIAARRLAKKIPIEIFLTPHQLNQRGLDAETRQSVTRAVSIGLLLYLLASVVATVHAEIGIDYLGFDQLTAFIDAIHRFDLLVAILSITTVVVGLTLAMWVLGKLPAITNAGIVITTFPPLGVLAGIIAATSFVPDQARSFITVAIVDNTDRVDRGSTAHELLLDDPLLTLVGALIVGLIVSGLVFTSPSILSYQRVNDGSLSGVAAGSLGVAFIVLAATFLHTSSMVVFLGISAVAVIWGIGEHTMVAAGELRSPDGKLPGSFYRLPIIQAVVTVTIAAVGAGAAVGIYRVSQNLTLDPVVALLAIGCTIIGLAAALFLLDG